MSWESDRTRPRLYDDPLAIRALAHPTRLALYLLVGRDGPVTAAAAGRQLGISQALASHHLRQLAKYGFVEPAAPGDGRERPWRTTATSFGTASLADNPDLAAAAGVLDEMLAEQAVAGVIDWHARSADWDPMWRDLAGTTVSTLYLTYDELRDLTDALHALIAPLAARRPRSDPAAVPISLTRTITPLPATAGGG